MYPQPIKIKKIELRETENMGQGFFALEDIAKSQQILIVTDQTFITCNRYSQYYQFQDLKNQASISNKVLFSYFLAIIKVTQNTQAQVADIYEYFKVLPPVIHSLLNWSIEELQLLENKQLIQITKKKKTKIKNNFQAIKSTMQKIWETPKTIHQYRIFSNKNEIQNVTIELVQYFYSVIESRSVYYSCSEDVNSNVGAIVPLLQLFNHSPNPQCEVMGNQRFIVSAVRPIKKGEEIFVSYGKNKEEKFLQLYGFLQNLEHPIPMNQNYRKKIAEEYNKIYRLKSEEKQTLSSETQT